MANEQLKKHNVVSKGIDHVMHQARLAGRAMVIVGLLGAAVGGSWMMMRVADYSNLPELSLSWMWSVWWSDQTTLKINENSKMIAMPDGGAKSLAELKKSKIWQEAREDKLQAFMKAGGEGLFLGSLASLVLVRIGRKRGHQLSDEQRVRGAELIDDKQLIQQVKAAAKKNGGLAPIKIGGVPMLAGMERQHILISGGTGVGKSVLISTLLEQIRAAGDRAVIVDRGGEYWKKFGDRSRDHLVNPHDCRSSAWHPLMDACSTQDLLRIVRSLIPPPSDNKDPFWSQAAGDLLESVMDKNIDYQLFSRGDWAGVEMDQQVAMGLAYLMHADNKQLIDLIKGTPAALALGDGKGKTAQSIISVLSPNIRPLLQRPLLQCQGDPLQLKRWVKDPAAGWIFQTVMPQHMESQKAEITCFIDTLLAEIMANGPTKRRTWLIVDELPSLNKIKSLQMALAEGRKYGVCAILGIQAVSQLREVYGKDGAQSITSCASTQIHYRSSDPDTADWVSNLLGSLEVESFKHGLTVAAADSRDSDNFSEQVRDKKLVMPSEIMQLPNFNAYIRLPAFPVAKIEQRPPSADDGDKGLKGHQAFQPVPAGLKTYAQLGEEAAQLIPAPAKKAGGSDAPVAVPAAAKPAASITDEKKKRYEELKKSVSRQSKKPRKKSGLLAALSDSATAEKEV